MILVDAETLAVHLQVSRSEVYRRVRQGAIRPYGPGGLRARLTGGMRFDLDNLSQTCQCAPPSPLVIVDPVGGSPTLCGDCRLPIDGVSQSTMLDTRR